MESASIFSRTSCSRTLPYFVVFLFCIFALILPACGHLPPLHNYAGGGSVPQVLILLNQGADADTRDEQGRTPLMYAAQNGRNNIVTLLIRRGADVNAKSKT